MLEASAGVVQWYNAVVIENKRLFTVSPYESPYFLRRRDISRWPGSWMDQRKARPTIELGMKVSVRRSMEQRIGVVTRVEGDYVFVRWINSDLGETAEYQAHRDELTPLAGWL
jgi:hypothetical protein